MNDALYAKARRIIAETLTDEPDDVLQALADAGLHLIEDQPLDLNEIVTEMGVVWSAVETSLAALGKAQDALSKLAGLLVSPPSAGTSQTGSEPAPNAGEPGALPSFAPAPAKVAVHCAWGCSLSIATNTAQASHDLMERHYRVDHGDSGAAPSSRAWFVDDGA